MKRLTFHVVTGLIEIIVLGLFVAVIALSTPSARADEIDPSTPLWDWGWLPLLLLGAYLCVRLIYRNKTKIEITEHDERPFGDTGGWRGH